MEAKELNQSTVPQWVHKRIRRTDNGEYIADGEFYVIGIYRTYSDAADAIMNNESWNQWCGRY